MKKLLLTSLFSVFCLLSFAIPSGCYEGTTQRHYKGRCAIQISNNTLHVINKSGDVIAYWNIKSDSNGRLTLESSLGAVQTASWWNEDGRTYLNFNYETFVLQ